MNRILFTIALLAFSFCSFGQDQATIHTFYMKDGSVFKGEIITKSEDGNYRIKTTSGQELVFSADQIKRVALDSQNSGMTSSEVNLEDYGGKQAIEISLIGASLVGVHYRIRAAKELFFDVGLHYTPTVLFNDFNDEAKAVSSFSVSGGANYFLHRHFKERKQKIRANGLFFNVTHTFGKYDFSSFAFGWASEYFKRQNTNRSFILELGPSLNVRHWVDDPSTFPYNYNQDKVMGGVFLRLKWVFFTPKK